MKIRKNTSPIWATDLETFKNIIIDSVSRIDVLRKSGLRPFGCNYERLGKRIRENNISVSHFIGQSDSMVKINRTRRQPIGNVLVSGSSYNKQRLKERILKKTFAMKEQGIRAPHLLNNKAEMFLKDAISELYRERKIE